MGFPSARLGKIADLRVRRPHSRNRRRCARKIDEETRKTQQRGGEKNFRVHQRSQLVGKHVHQNRSVRSNKTRRHPSQIRIRPCGQSPHRLGAARSWRAISKKERMSVLKSLSHRGHRGRRESLDERAIFNFFRIATNSTTRAPVTNSHVQRLSASSVAK